jgi:hypothetical protein
MEHIKKAGNFLKRITTKRRRVVTKIYIDCFIQYTSYSVIDTGWLTGRKETDDIADSVTKYRLETWATLHEKHPGLAPLTSQPTDFVA